MKVVKSSLLAVMCMCLAVSVFAKNPSSASDALAAGKADYVKIYDAGGDYKVELPYDYQFYTNRTLLAAYISGVNEAKKVKNNEVKPANAIRMYVFNKLVDPDNQTSLRERLTRLSAKATWELLLPSGETTTTPGTSENVQKFAALCKKKYENDKAALRDWDDFVYYGKWHGLIPLDDTVWLRALKCWIKGLEACGWEIRLR